MNLKLLEMLFFPWRTDAPLRTRIWWPASQLRFNSKVTTGHVTKMERRLEKTQDDAPLRLGSIGMPVVPAAGILHFYK